MTANVALGMPAAAILVCLLREALRSLLALLLGFRVFEIRWGAGRRCVRRPVGPVDLAWAPIPLAGATVARSGRAHRHRVARVALAIAPTAAQLIWLGGRLITGTRPGAAPLFEGPAPLACLDAASCLMLVLHATFALELPGGVRTDVRLLLDALLGPADSERAARASYYARLARHRLERSDVTGARGAIALGSRQLGPEPLLVDADRLLRRSALASVVDQFECADALQRAIEQAEPRRRIERAGWSRGERLRQGFFSGLPVALALLALAGVQADRLVRSIEAGMLVVGERMVERGDPEACTAMTARWQRWSDRIDPWLPPSPDLSSDRQLALARLALCRGDLEAAERHEGAALLAANDALVRDGARGIGDPERWLAAELRVTRLLRLGAEREARSRAHRNALRSLTRVDQRLARLRTQLALLENEARVNAEEALDREALAVEQARSGILAQLAAR
jgi:hypothetical protein